MSKRLYRISAVVVAVCMLIAACSSLIACKPTGGNEVEILTVRDIVLDTTNAKTEFAYGEEFTAEGLKVTAILSDGSERDIPLEKCRLSKVRNTPGKRKVSVTYAKKTKRYEVVFADKPMPPISSEVKLEITGVKTDGAYRVQAEDIDFAVSGVNAVGGELVVSGDGADGGKYIANYGNTDNYFGFTFNSDAEYKDVTLNVRLANPSTEHVMQPGSNIMMYLNYAGTSDNGSLGITRSAAVPKSNEDGLVWSDFVVRGLNIKEGINTLTFGVLDGVVPCIDYIDFYVGKYFSTSSIDLAAAGASTVLQFEDMGLEKITTRDDYLAAYDLEQGEICVRNVANADGGKAVFALQQGELSTIINAETNSTVQLILSAACNVNYDWKFIKDAEIKLDGQTLKFNEHNIRDQSQENAYLWKDSSLGFYDLGAGEHLLDIKINNQHASFDALTVKTVSAGGFMEQKPEVYIDGAGTFVMEGEHLDPSNVVVRKDYAELVIGQQYGAYNLVNDDSASGRCAIDGFTGFPDASTNPYGEKVDKTVFTVKLYLAKAATVNIYAVAASQLGVNFRIRNQMEALVDGKVYASDPCNLSQYWNASTSEFEDPTFVETRVARVEMSAGEHEFQMNVNNFFFILDCFKFEVASFGSYAYDVTVDKAGTYYAEAEDLDPTGVIARDDFVKAGLISSATDEYSIGADSSARGGYCILGMKQGFEISSKFMLNDKAKVKIYIGAKSDAGLGVVVYNKSHLLFSVDDENYRRPPEQPALNSDKVNDTTTRFVERYIGLWTLDEGAHTFNVKSVNFYIELDYIKFEVISYGDDAAYDFVADGVGNYYVEAEDLDPTGAKGRSDFVDAGRIFYATDAFCIESSTAARGGYNLTGFAKGTSLTSKFRLEENANLRIYMTCKSGAGIAIWNETHEKFYVDGNQITPNSQQVMSANGGNWIELEISSFIRLGKGEHTLTLEMFEHAYDLDYLRFEVIGYGESNDITFTGNGTSNFEAEWIDDCEIVLADPTNFPVTDGYKFHVMTDIPTCGNGRYVNGLKNGTVMRVNFRLGQSATVKIVAAVKSGIGVVLNSHCTFKIDDDTLTLPNEGAIGGRTDFTDRTITSGVNLAAGNHTLIIDMAQFPFDFDCLKFTISDYGA